MIKPEKMEPRDPGAWVTLGVIVRRALSDQENVEESYRILRTTYLKPQYSRVFPKAIFRKENRPWLHEESRKVDYELLDNRFGRCFIRNLWFAHQFLPRPRDVVKFLTATEPEQHSKMFEQRFTQLNALAAIYQGWLKKEADISQKVARFEPTKIDLLTIVNTSPSSTPMKTIATILPGSAAVADLIRGVEQRASYKAGNSKDSCEKALYFLALGRPDIAQAIVNEVLAENPDDAVALYANAVLHLNASRRNQRQALIHDVMHPHGLEPLEAEEFYHADRYAEESMESWKHESQAFLLMLKALQNWPAKFSIKCYDLAPDMWKSRVVDWIILQAASRLNLRGDQLSLPEPQDTKLALNALRQLIPVIMKDRGRDLFQPDSVVFLTRFITVASCLEPELACNCLRQLIEAVAKPRQEKVKRASETNWPYLMVSPEPTLAEKLLSSIKSPAFCRVVFNLLSKQEAGSLLWHIAEIGLSDKQQRLFADESIDAREVVLNLLDGDGYDEAADICRGMIEKARRSRTELGKQLESCWNYSLLLIFFRSAKAALDANNLAEAAESAAYSLEHAFNSFATIAENKPLVKFIESDEDGDFEVMGDFLTRRPSILADAKPMDFDAPTDRWSRFQGGLKGHWGDFDKWAAKNSGQETPLLIAFGHWLVIRHGQDRLLPLCDNLAMKRASAKAS
jgi:hypothetical protein